MTTTEMQGTETESTHEVQFVSLQRVSNGRMLSFPLIGSCRRISIYPKSLVNSQFIMCALNCGSKV